MTVSVHASGYYAAELLAFIRGQSGLPPAPEAEA